MIICNSSHLTSFAVLVDVSGGHEVHTVLTYKQYSYLRMFCMCVIFMHTTQGFSAEERKALSIISYIGCGISLICLIIAIIALLYYR